METMTQRFNTAWIRAEKVYERLHALALTRALTEEELEALLEVQHVRDKIVEYESSLADADRLIARAEKWCEVVEGTLYQIEQQAPGEDQP